MLKKVSIGDIHAGIKDKIEKKTGLKAYDVVPDDEPNPLVVIQAIGKQDNSTKTMYIEDFKFYIHAICEGNTSENIYNLIQKVEEALTEPIDLEGESWLVSQTQDGVLQILTEDTGEKHAVLQYSLKVCYGFKCK